MTARIESPEQAPALRPPSTASSQPGAFARALASAIRSIDRGATAPSCAAGELEARGALELQAAVYRDAERLELASKLLDHGVGAVKTILQTRV